jgi:DNA-directed RNA polymerase specialized sigma24 family protein
MSGHESERSKELQELLRRLRPRILRLLQDHAVPEQDAAEVVHDTFMALAVRWGRVGNREAWILGTIEARCRAVSAERSALEAARRADAEAPGGEDDPEGSDDHGRS